jgi:hypothetical protein
MSDKRTRQYTGGAVPATPVAIDIRDAIHTSGGRLAVLALANAIVRNHPRTFVRAADVRHDTGVSVHALLQDIANATMTSHLEIVDALPDGIPTIGIGEDVDRAHVYVGADRFTGTIADHARRVTADPSTAWGAGAAAMRAANHVFRVAIGLEPPALGSASLWCFGPASDSTGPSDPGPISVGSVWLIGAGGVGSSLAWWVHHFGSIGSWTIIDHDRVDDTNLNRCLGLFARHLSSDQGRPALKSDVAADLIKGSRTFPETWDAWAATDPSPPDVLIPAANDFGVRGQLASYSHPLALTGATSPNWTADLHLYRAGLDGCIDCRHPGTGTPSFACSTASVPTLDGGSRDASLSFLSGMAALLCATALVRLQAGELVGPFNHWQFALHPTRRAITANKQRCQGGTAHALAEDVRRSYFGDTRWAS